MLQQSPMAPVGLVHPRLRQVPFVPHHPHSGILMAHLAIKEGSKLAEGPEVYALVAVR